MPLVVLAVLALAAAGGAAAGRPADGGPPGGDPAHDGGLASYPLTALPPRPEAAESGTAFAERTTGIGGAARQRAAVAEILAGNVPDFVRHLRPVRLERTLAGGRRAEAVVWVSPDYVAIGDDDDFLRMPLTLRSATSVARALGCVLPTSRIVDAIWEQADHRLAPAPLPPSPRMRSSEYYLRHRRQIEGQREGLAPGALISGHKKDVVLTNKLARIPGRIAIYGWHRKSGRPIQPLSTVHGASYADYSHGLRLVGAAILLDGAPESIYRVLEDPALAPILSDEGAIRNLRRTLGVEASPRVPAEPRAVALAAPSVEER